MKKIICILIITFLSWSCNKDFLSIPPQNFISSATFYKTQDDFTQGVNATYAQLRGIYQTAWAMGEMRSDNTHYIYKADDRGLQNQDFEKIADFNEDATNQYLYNKWANDYGLVSRANQVLANIDNATFDETAKKGLKGESLFLRAFAYFDLVQYFGSVPLHLTLTKGMDDAGLPKSPVADIYKQIITDALEASALLPGKPAQEKGRATTGSAKMLLGYAYLSLKQYSDAEKVLKDIVSSNNYSLLADYASVFDLSNKNSSESVFEVQYMQGSQGLNSNFIYNFIPGLTDTKPITGVSGNNQTFGGWNTPTEDLINSYEDGDKRKNASIGYYTAGAITYPYIKKYLHEHANFNNTDDNWPVYRYSDVLLLLAEALNEQGKGADALPYLNAVRQRASLPAITTVDQASLKTIILKERRMELAFENHRWLDLIRAGKAIEIMTAYGSKVKAFPQLYYYPVGYGPLQQSYNITESKLIFPIPESQVLLNPQLK